MTHETLVDVASLLFPLPLLHLQLYQLVYRRLKKVAIQKKVEHEKTNAADGRPEASKILQ